MTDIEIKELDLSKLKKEIKEELEAEAKAKKAQEDAFKAAIKEAVEGREAELTAQHQEELKKLSEKKSAPAFNQVAGKYHKSSGMDELRHWMKTGDGGNERVLKRAEWSEPEAGRKALQIGSDTEGGYLVPEDFYQMIVDQKSQIAWTENAGIRRIQTDLTNVQVPTVSTVMSKFEVTAEEGAYSDSDPIFGEVDITVYKFTRMNKFSEELIGDEKANLLGWYADELADAWARTESYYVAIGTGSSQPQGVFVGGTAGLTFDSTGNITPDEIPELFYKLGNGYRQNAVWLMNDDTEGMLRKTRDANDFAFDMRGANVGVRGDWKYETFYGGKPIYTESGVSTLATGLKTVLVGDFNFYGIVEREGLAIARNPYLYQANGQIGFFSKVRWGGAVLQATAFQYGTMA